MLGFDPERVVALRGLDSVTFKRPVRIGETIRVEADVEEAKPLDDGHELITLRWRVLAAGDRLAVRARVQVVHRTLAASTNGNRASNEQRATSNELYGDQVLL